MAIGETARLIASLELDPRKFTRGVDQALGKLGKLEGGLSRIGRGGGQLASGLGRVGLILGGAVVTGIGGAAKAAIDFEDAFAGVRKTVDEADLTAVGLSFDQLARKFRDMATEIPIAATEFARLGEIAGALGVKANDLDDFVKTTALLGVTTNLTADEAAEALGKVGTILGLTGDQYEHFADVLVNLGNKGASTESEILEVAKRFAGVGRQAGLTNEQILALSSSITSLGAEPEAGGSALSRIFANMSTEIANGTKKGQAFAKITGDSMDELRKRINKGDALGILMETLKGISGLSRTNAASVLKALGITNVRDRDAILKMAQNLDVVNTNLNNATDSVGALGVESQKRFDTIASKIRLFKQNVIEAGITVGEGLTPAIGRATDKLVAFLKDPVNKGQLKALGEDIGAAIDKIEWDKVLDGAKTFVGILKDAGGFAIGILETLNKLPTEVKAAGLGLIGLNKLSGGLIGAGIGNIVGGLAETLTRSLGSMLPGVGKLFVQPVFVTGAAPGVFGLGGGVGGAAGGAAVAGGAKGGLGIFGALGVAGFILAITDPIGNAIRDAAMDAGLSTGKSQSQEAKERAAAFSGKEQDVVVKNYGQIAAAISEKSRKNLQPLPKNLTPKEQKTFNKERANAETNRINLVTVTPAERKDADETQRKLTAIRDSNERNRIDAAAKMQAVANAVNTAKVNQIAAQRTGDASIVAAVRNSRPIVNVNVTAKITASSLARAQIIRGTYGPVRRGSP